MKRAAHDKWVCVACRWTQKLPLLDDRTPDKPSYACPTCRVRMVCCGTAFRPPRQDDAEGWAVVDGLLAAGFRFRPTRTRQRVPRTRKELEKWLQQRAGESWLPERTVAIRRQPGEVASVRVGRRLLTDREPVLLWQAGAWVEAVLRLFGDGGRPLAAPVVLLSSPRRSVPLSPRSRLRAKT